MLRFSLRTEYGLRALMELAARRGDGPIPAREIAKHQRVPLRFLEHQLAALHKAGIISSQRGAGGGCSLARDPSEVRVSEIVEVLEGPMAAMYCLDPHDETCPNTHHCGLQELWTKVEQAVRNVIEQTTLSDLVTRHVEMQPLLWPVMPAR
jgi:Rrf2 family cysteine metabolism transcriptional repressor